MDIKPKLPPNAIDISEWCGADLDVFFCVSKIDKVYVRGRICGHRMEQDNDGNLFARIVCVDPMWATGYWSVGERVERGPMEQGNVYSLPKGQWDWVKPPKPIRELEAILAKAKADEAMDLAKEAAEAAEVAKATHDDDDSESVRGGSPRATKLRRVATNPVQS